MRLFILAGLCMAVAAADFTHYHIEKRVDELMPVVNDYIHQQGLDRIRIPDFFYEAAPVFIGVTLSNLSTIYRKGDAEMWEVDQDTLSVKVTVGLRDMELHTDLCPFMHNSFRLTIEDATVDVTFTWHPEGKLPCVTTWMDFHITELKGLVFHTANPDWDQKPPPDYIVRDLITHYNKYDNIPECKIAAAKKLDLCQPLYYAKGPLL